MSDAHRDRVARLAKDGCLTLARRYDANGKSKLLCVRPVPKDERFSEDSIADLTAGERPTRAFKDKVIGVFPELGAQIGDRPTQTQVKEAIQAVADSLPEDECELADAPLPTGIDKSIGALLPEPIYIPAVKDLADETKTKESSPFGKLLAILLDQIEGTLLEEQELFERLNAKLNRVPREDGTVQDDRLSELREIETTVERYLQETFSSVTLKINIPPPEIKTILSAAQIFADDGVEGLIDTKGDGLRRAVVFSILMAYMALRRTDVTDGEEDTERLANRYLLLFEEPELFLHPKAQLILFAALGEFANEHDVVLTTHSPYFCGPDATATFIKLHKHEDISIAPKPYTIAHAIDLSDMSAKDQFQIICYENNNAAFFANTLYWSREIATSSYCRTLPRRLIHSGKRAGRLSVS